MIMAQREFHNRCMECIRKGMVQRPETEDVIFLYESLSTSEWKFEKKITLPEEGIPYFPENRAEAGVVHHTFKYAPPSGHMTAEQCAESFLGSLDDYLANLPAAGAPEGGKTSVFPVGARYDLGETGMVYMVFLETKAWHGEDFEDARSAAEAQKQRFVEALAQKQ